MNRATPYRVVKIAPLPSISEADLKPSFLDEYRGLMQEIALDHQWQLLVDLTGSVEAAADVVGATPFLGIPRRAREILEARHG